jgi:Tfp pilus assembly protein PilF
MTRALAAQRQGALAEAKDLYDRAIKVGPVSAALYNNYGALLHDMGNSHDAVAMLRLALSLDQTFSSAWVNLGNSEDALGDRGTAVSAYNQALKLDPSSRDAKVGLAWQYIDIGSFLDARRLLADVLRASPDFAPAHYALGQALEGDKDRTGAAHEFSRFLELGGASAKPGLDAEVRAHVAALGKPE